MTAPAHVPPHIRAPAASASLRGRGAGLALLALAAFAWAGAAQAETAFSAAVSSDYRFRGISLSDGRPALTASFNYDAEGGGYVGLTGVAAATAHNGFQALGYQAYAGYARRLGSGDSWDVGVAHTDITEYYRPPYAVRYSEVYAGWAGRNLSAHVYYSPSYLGERVATVYANLDGSITPSPDWRLFAHAGVLTPVTRRAGSDLRNPQYDARVGVARRIRSVELQLSGVTVGPDADYPANHPQKREAVVLSAAYYF
jgi:uncharacterized protein (TIGR02001 family)